MANPLLKASEAFGVHAPASDHIPLSAPATDYEIPGGGARVYVVLTPGTVAVRTLAGEDRTFDAPPGVTIATAITHVLADTTSDLLLLVD